MLRNALKHPIQALAQAWQDLPLATKGIVVIALPLAVLLASLASLYLREQQAVFLENKLRLALQNQRDIQTVHTQLVEASTGVRDYLLTGQKNFLNIYYDAERKLPIILHSLHAQLEDDGQKKRLTVITTLAKKNLAELKILAKNELDTATDELIEQFRSQGRTLDRLRTEIEIMNTREAVLVAQDQVEVNQGRQRNIVLTLVAAIAGILGALAGAWLFSNTIVKRVRLLRDSAAHLARGEALALPSSSRDELGQLSEELDHAAQLLSKSTNDAHQARHEAEVASASKTMFLSRTSHELRTPLNAILGFAQLLENDLPQGKQRDSVTLIKNAGEHLLKLINEVLDIARIESGDLTLVLSPVEIAPLLNEAIQFISPLGKIRDIEIQSDYPQGLTALADRQKLMQVVLNLLSNALKYGPANSTVNVSAYIKDDRAIIEVLDAGIGIPKHLKARVFTPFDRLGAEQTKTEGTGLGLALSRQIMTSMHGSVHVADDKSLFWLTLPATKTVTKDKKASPSHPLDTIQSLANKHKILYVEDNASNLALVEAIISRHKSLRLYSVKTVWQAMRFLNEITPEIILLDLHLPDGTGEDLVIKLKSDQRYAHTPIIMVSADALPETIARLKAAGATDYFTKPLDISAFNQRLKELIHP